MPEVELVQRLLQALRVLIIEVHRGLHETEFGVAVQLVHGLATCREQESEDRDPTSGAPGMAVIEDAEGRLADCQPSRMDSEVVG